VIVAQKQADHQVFSCERLGSQYLNQTVEDVKTTESRRNMPPDPSLTDVLKAWMFASPSQLGRLPWSYDQVLAVYQKAASAAGIGRLGTHSLRHTYRSLLDSVGTPVAVQQKLMRHTDIRTTVNVYGGVITNQESEALAKIERPCPRKRHASSTRYRLTY
jgi:integrase